MAKNIKIEKVYFTKKVSGKNNVVLGEKIEKIYSTKKVSGKNNIVLGKKVSSNKNEGPIQKINSKPVSKKKVSLKTSSKQSSSNNLTSKQLITWKNDVDTAITKILTNSLKRTYEDIVKLQKITASSQDSNSLNQRFKELANATQQITKKLTSCMKSFDTNLTTFIKTIESSEKDISAKVKSSINKISEASARISKIK